MKDNTKTRMTTFIKMFKISEEIGILWSSQSFEGKYNIEFGIHIEFPSQRNFFNSNRSINKEIMHIKNAKKHFYISVFCSLTGRPTEKIFTEQMFICKTNLHTKNWTYLNQQRRKSRFPLNLTYRQTYIQTDFEEKIQF